jgi:predicted neuraminidase
MIVSSEFIFETSPTPSCHATTIVETASGLAAAWFGGMAEGKPDVGIWFSRQVGGRWLAPVEIATGVQPDGTRLPCWNPVLFQPKGGPLRLFYKIGPSPQTWWGVERTSTDGGQRWSDAQLLPAGMLGPIKNKPVELPNGDLLCPSSTESAEKPSKWQVHFERRTPQGHWSATPPLNDGLQISAIQPSILFAGGSRLIALGRTRQGHLFQIASPDEGATWQSMTLLDVPNPNSGTDAVTLRDGRHLLVFNNTPKGRTPLNVALSTDGTAWTPVLQLETESGEYSYPAVIQARDGLVHVTYTWKRQRVRHVVLSVK